MNYDNIADEALLVRNTDEWLDYKAAARKHFYEDVEIEESGVVPGSFPCLVVCYPIDVDEYSGGVELPMISYTFIYAARAGALLAALDEMNSESGRE